MNDLTHRLAALSSAEDFLGFFGIPFEPSVVHVNRLHILKRFQQYLRQDDGLAGLDDVGLFARYRTLLARAYDDFTRSTAQRERVFKVFQDADGPRVALDALRATLPSARERRI